LSEKESIFEDPTASGFSVIFVGSAIEASLRRPSMIATGKKSESSITVFLFF
jgi:hypothetical protein